MDTLRYAHRIKTVPTFESVIAMREAEVIAEKRCASTALSRELGDDSAVFPRLDADCVEILHSRIRELVALDVRFGGDHTAGSALQLFRSVHRELTAGRCDPAVQRDLFAAAGELGEVAGWLLYDAGEHELVRRTNHEALHLSRLAGDHSMELLLVQNISMHAGHLGRPGEALRAARMVLETNTLSARLGALFRIRLARALAQGGAETEARRAFDHAHSLYLDGVRDDDPAWAWWINDEELSWHEAMIQRDSGHPSSAAEILRESLDGIPEREVRRRYNHLAALIEAQVRAGAWSDLDQSVALVLPFIDEVGSTRAATTLLGAVESRDTVKVPREATEPLRALLT